MAALYGAITRFNDIDNSVISSKIGEAKLGVDIGSLTNYTIPTLFITGDQDVLFEASYIEALAVALPGASCINLGKVGHSSYFELPGAFNQVLDEFLTSLDK